MADTEYPCDHCSNLCDSWKAQYCCVLCEFLGNDNCDSCDPMDI